MTATWIKGLGLAALLAMTASASAQGPKKDMKRSGGEGPRGAGFGGGGPGGFGGGGTTGGGFPGGGPAEIQRIRAEVKELDAKISRLESQIDEATRRLDRAALSNKIADKGGPGKGGPGRSGDMGKGPPDFKKFADGPRFAPEMKKFAGKGKELAKEKGKDFKGPPMGGRGGDMKRNFERPKGPPAGFGRGSGGFGRGSAGFDRGGMNRFGPPAGFGRGGPGGFGPGMPPGRFEPREMTTSRGGPDIEGRLNRIERTLEEIRRELRNRR